MMRVCWLLLLVFLPSGFAQAPERNKGNCVVEGRVINAQTSEPVRKARVFLRSPVVFSDEGEQPRDPNSGGATASAITNLDGRFILENVQAGQYILNVTRTGFVRGRYSSPSRTGGILELRPGERISDVVVALTPAGVISGRVVDADRDPVPRAAVSVLKRIVYEGKPELIPLDSVQTNDFGEFRLFDLLPGRYYLRATPGNRDGLSGARTIIFDRVDSEGTDEVAPTYFPGTADAARAEPVDVQPGQEARVEITVVTTRTYRIRGRVVGGPAKAEGGQIGVTAMPADSGLLGAQGSHGFAVVSDGTFEISGLTAGSYVVRASLEDERIRLIGQVSVEVTSGDVEGVVIALTEGLTIKGSIRFEATPPEKVTRMVVYLSSDAASFSAGGYGEVKEDGSFVMEHVFDGQYRVEISGLPSSYYIKSARAGRLDCTDDPLEVRGGVSGPLELRIGKATAQVSGVVRDSQGSPVPYAGVFLIGEKKMNFSTWPPAQSDPNGAFRMTDVRPGAYYLIALANEEWEPDVDSFDWLSGETWKTKGIKVKVEETGSQIVEVRLTKLKE